EITSDDIKFYAYDKITNEEIDIALNFEGGLILGASNVVNAGRYAIEIGTLKCKDGSAYSSIELASAFYEISKKSIGIVITNADANNTIYHQYGDAEATNANGTMVAIAADFVAYEGASYVINGKLSRTNGIFNTEDYSKDAGRYVITTGDLESDLNPNYSFRLVDEDGNLTAYTYEITKRNVYVVPKRDVNLSSTYGNRDNVINYTAYYSDLGTPIPSNESLYGELKIVYPVNPETGSFVKNAGSYSIELGTLNGGNNYTIVELKTSDADGDIKYVVNKRPINVTASNKEQFFGDNKKALSFTVNNGGYAPGENTLLGALYCVATENAEIFVPGTYNIEVGTLADSNPNYSISFNPGIYTIKPRPVTVTANNYTKAYGQPDPEFGYVMKGSAQTSGIGAIAGYEPSFLITVNGRGAGEVTGKSYEIVISEDPSNTFNAYYSFNFVKGKLEIQRVSTVIAFKDTDVALNTTGSVLNLTYNRIGHDLNDYFYVKVGDGIITFSAINLVDAGTYQVSLNVNDTINYKGTFASIVVNIAKYDLGTINPKDALTSLIKDYGAIDPDFTLTLDGISVEGDVEPVAITLERETGEDKGVYDFVGLTLDNVNYTANLDEVNSLDAFEIKPYALVVTPAKFQKEYGDVDPSLVETVEGINGQTVTLSYTRQAGESVVLNGENYYAYLLNDTIVTDNANYIASFADGIDLYAFAIIPKVAYVNAIAYERFYDATDASIDEVVNAFTYSGFVDGEEPYGTLKFADDVIPSGAGQYEIVQDTLINANNPNYDIVYTSAFYTIKRANVTVTANSTNVEYGYAPTLTYTYEGTLYDGYELVGELALEEQDSYPVNYSGYHITQGTLNNDNNANYNIIYISSAVCTVKPRAIEVIPASGLSHVYGDELTPITYTLGVVELVDGEELAGALSIDGMDAGTHNVTIGSLQELNPNYLIALNTATYVVEQRAVTITANDVIVEYGDSNQVLTYSVDNAVANDEFVGALAVDITDVLGEFTITQGTLTDVSGNYVITYVSGKYTIIPRKVTITIHNVESDYNEPIKDLTNAYTITAGTVVDGDNLGITLTKEPGNAMGDYAITGSYANARYEVTFVDGIYTILKYTAVLTAEEYEINFVEDGETRYIAASVTSGAQIYYSVNDELVENGFSKAGKYVVTLTADETDYYYAPAPITVTITINQPVIETEANGIDVSITTDGGFAPDVTVKMEKLAQDDFRINEVLTGKQSVLRAFSIVTVDANGEQASVNGKTIVTIKVPKDVADQEFVKMVLSENGNYAIKEIAVVDGYVTIEVDNISSFAFVAEQNNNYLIIIVAGLGALIVLGSVLFFMFRKKPQVK
ncbi:MAG: hypothetical protein J6R35_05250, partial [Clostridia bacterium]|nr:hypothetical protein [Clostridia bacterium]